MPLIQQPEAQGAMYVAQSSGVIRLGGKLRRYIAGQTILAEDDPLRQRLPARFRLVAPVAARVGRDARPVAELPVPSPVVEVAAPAINARSTAGARRRADVGDDPA